MEAWSDLRHGRTGKEAIGSMGDDKPLAVIRSNRAVSSLPPEFQPASNRDRLIRETT